MQLIIQDTDLEMVIELLFSRYGSPTITRRRANGYITEYSNSSYMFCVGNYDSILTVEDDVATYIALSLGR